VVAAGAGVAVALAAADPAAQPPLALYIHVPFCLSLCPYCDFVVYAGRAARGPRSRLDTTVDALHTELDLRADALDALFGPPAGWPSGAARPPLASVYLGGGTPSLLHPGQVSALLEHVGSRMGIAPGAEVTLEANPGPRDRGDLAGFRAAGVTRLSLGAQALDRDALRRIGRRHDPDDVRDAVRLARSAGFRSVSLDLLTDLPGQRVADWERTLRAALVLEPDHLSVYSLTLDDPDAEGLTGPAGDHLPVRPGARRWRERARAAQDEDRAAAMESVTDELATAAGLRRYEIANLARPAHESRHNLAYWERRAYEAIGPGAHACDGALRRRWNTARLDAYLAALRSASPALPPGGAERLAPDQAILERAMLGLRLSVGIEADLADHPLVAPALAWGTEAGLVERERGPRPRARLTARGRLLANELFARLVVTPDRSREAR
jgi:putative oxygen-independent coproporphyrinogen III oxidase